MAIPTRHLLDAALQAGRVFDLDGTEATVVLNSYFRLPTGGIHHPDDLVRGQKLLESLGLVELHNNMYFPTKRLRELIQLEREEAHEILLACYMNREPPPWLSLATGFLSFDESGEGISVAAELIPTIETETLQVILPDADRREAFLMALGIKHEAEAKSQLGELGEVYVVAETKREFETLGRPDLAERVRRVSAISDQLGYDVVAPTLGDSKRRMEVKTTRKLGHNVEFFITRNEAEVAQRDPTWSLVICRVEKDDTVDILGWCAGSAIECYLPTDRNPRGRWTVSHISLSISALEPGLPPCQ